MLKNLILALILFGLVSYNAIPATLNETIMFKEVLNERATFVKL